MHCFDTQAWANEIYARNLMAFGVVDKVEVHLRAHIATTYRTTACLYMLLIAPGLQSYMRRRAQSCAAEDDHIPTLLNTEDYAATTLKLLSFVPAASPLFKYTTWPVFMTGVETALPERRAWVMGRMQAMLDLCPWGMLTAAMETLTEIWQLRDAATATSEGGDSIVPGDAPDTEHSLMAHVSQPDKSLSEVGAEDVAAIRQDVEQPAHTDYDVDRVEKVYRKLDLRIIPAFWVLYFLCSAIRSNIGLAQTMNADVGHDLMTVLDLTPRDVSATLTLFYVSYVIFDCPSNLIMSKLSPRVWMSRIVFAVGVIGVCFTAVRDAWSVKPWTLKDLGYVLMDWRLWPLTMMYFGVVGVGIGTQMYGTVIIRGIDPDFTGVQLSLLFAPIWIMDLIAILLVTPIADRFHRLRPVFFSCATCIQIAGLLTTTFAPVSNPWARYGGLLMVGFGLGPTVPTCMTWTNEIFQRRHGEVGVAAASALVSGLGNLGSVTTTYALYVGWPADAAPGPHQFRKSNLIMIAILCVSILSSALMFVLLKLFGNEPSRKIIGSDSSSLVDPYDFQDGAARREVHQRGFSRMWRNKSS
ncbi:hypothetical protein DL764_004733 [Monosporascus ibericus]|uniref:Major facilitator superfamily (MFS) profile domain-containing protein n=1 Tax=Monosporascus ibericus TaxID=155417 RepID=A0A4V1XAV2_9PEZI|nr:hypothetical protein DL764_004733 [Monosporascus ibericus]